MESLPNQSPAEQCMPRRDEALGLPWAERKVQLLLHALCKQLQADPMMAVVLKGRDENTTHLLGHSDERRVERQDEKAAGERAALIHARQAEDDVADLPSPKHFERP